MHQPFALLGSFDCARPERLSLHHVAGILHGLAQDDQQRDAIFRSKCPQVCHSYISSACIAQKQRDHTYCISSPNSGPGLDSPQQGGCQAPADWNHVQCFQCVLWGLSSLIPHPILDPIWACPWFPQGLLSIRPTYKSYCNIA